MTKYTRIGKDGLHRTTDVRIFTIERDDIKGTLQLRFEDKTYTFYSEKFAIDPEKIQEDVSWATIQI